LIGPYTLFTGDFGYVEAFPSEDPTHEKYEVQRRALKALGVLGFSWVFAACVFWQILTSKSLGRLSQSPHNGLV
jgi:cell division septal protein FtsQ